ncbi:MAG: hypothetical protein Q9162_000201 [Coniocarpon cinnabarinum]
MSKQSSVGTSTAYEAGDQRNYTKADLESAKENARFEEGQPGSHDLGDKKDERSLPNKLAAAQKKANEPDLPQDMETFQSQKDSTLPAKAQGNVPSKGAQIDQELREEDEAAKQKKGEWGSKQQ